MTDEKRALKVFLCHAHSDKDAVRELYQRLKGEGWIEPWLDLAKILPGQHWTTLIRQSLADADSVIILISNNSIDREGFVQREMNYAWDLSLEKPRSTIYLIPLRIEDCEVPFDLRERQWADYFGEWKEETYNALLQSLKLRHEQKLRVEAEEHARQERQRQEREFAAKARLEAEELERLRLAREKAKKDVAEKNRLKVEERERLAKEKVAGEKAEKEAAEKARLEADELERQRIAKEKADRDATEKTAREKAEREAVEKARLKAEELERQRIAREIEEKSDREKVEDPKPVAAMQKPSQKMIAVIAGVIVVFVAIFGLPWKQWFIAAPDVTVTPTNTAIFTPAPPTATKTLTKVFTPTDTPLSTATPVVFNPHPDSSDYIDAYGVPMRLVSAGEFSMGSENGESDELPVHTVYLNAFYMDKYEVTNAHYKACVEAGGCTTPKNTDQNYNPNYENHPVVFVDWNQSAAYCKWRSASLPTEAQWEKAARGTDKRTYPWGEGIDCDKANYAECKGGITPVGSYESGKSPYGIYDLAGNVWEWVSSLYKPYPYVSTDGREDLNISGNRVLRGGSWYFVDYGVRSALRNNYSPDEINYNVGFRCARSP